MMQLISVIIVSALIFIMYCWTKHVDIQEKGFHDMTFTNSECKNKRDQQREKDRKGENENGRK